MSFSHPQFSKGRLLAAAVLAAAVGLGAAAAPTRPAPRTPPRPAPRPTPPPVVTAATLPATLKALSYPAETHGQYQRIRIEEEGKEYGYFVDLSFTKSGEALVGMAHLAPIPDLTKVAAGPLLGLLAQNDEMVGAYFSYDKVNGRLILNASAPARGLDAARVRRLVDGLRGSVLRTEGLWDTSRW
jgi:hypothetical protein